MDTLIARTGTAQRRLATALAFAAVLAGIAMAGSVHAQSWTFDTPQSGADAWTAERGTLTLDGAETRLQPDANRRVVLLSPAGLPDSVRVAEQFLVQVAGTGLQRVRIQGRRNARGGWITIADATGAALRSTAAGYVIRRKSGARDGPIERLRMELEFRTTNLRVLKRIAIIPPKD
jgi:hypothetical protein